MCILTLKFYIFVSEYLIILQETLSENLDVGYSNLARLIRVWYLNYAQLIVTAVNFVWNLFIFYFWII